MQKQDPLFEDFARLMSSIAGTVAGVGREAEVRVKEKFRDAVGGTDMVTRDEFDAIKAMASETRTELEALKAEVAALKAEIAAGRVGGA